MGMRNGYVNPKKLASALKIRDVDAVENAIKESTDGGFCTIWEVEDKGKYSVARLSTTNKNRDGERVVDFQDSFVNLVGQAHEFVKKHGVGEKGLFCKIVDFEVTKKNGKEDSKKIFTNYAVFKLEEYGNNSGGSSNNAPAKKVPAKVKTESVYEDEPILPF